MGKRRGRRKVGKYRDRKEGREEETEGERSNFHFVPKLGKMASFYPLFST